MTIRIQTAAVMLATLICGALAAPVIAGEPDASSPPTVTLETLAPLVGVWRDRDAPEATNLISFEWTANQTVLVETWMVNGNKRSLTLYHQDGDALLATHYCPQGNQPRLKMTESSTPTLINFTFQDATNLDSPTDNHQHSLSLTLPSPGTDFIRREMYLSEKGEDHSTRTLVQVSTKPE